MNKGILNSAYFIFLVVLLLAACQKVDNNKIPPVIILKGSNPQILILGCEYIEQGVDVVDDKSEGFEVSVSDNINQDVIGSYFVEYTAVDSDSNVSMARREVIIEAFEIDDYAGGFMVYDSIDPLGPYKTYQASASVKSNNPPLVEIANFNDFGENFKVLFVPDSLGNITLSYNQNDTIITGTGSTFCDKTGFRLDYLLQIINSFDEYHRTTFKVNGN